MKATFTLAIIISVLLAGCEDRKNPIAEANPSDVQTWLMRLESDAMKHCATFWQVPENAPANELKACEAEKQRIATAMNSGGFSNVEVLPEDLELKAVWMTYSTELAARAERQKKYDETNDKSRENVKKLLPHLRNQ